MNLDAFFTLHRGLPREGPGGSEDLDWACQRAGLARDARILDAGCGPGADIAGLLEHAPEGHVTAVDKHAPFIDTVRTRFGDDPRVSVRVEDMAVTPGPFDFVWCAGALYFLGLEPGLKALAAKLAPGGVIAFSELVYIGAAPPEDLRAALEREYPAITDHVTLQTRIAEAGFDLLGQRVLPPASWEAYYQPMERRITALRPGADAALAAVLDEAEVEIALWRCHYDEFGYALSVVRPA